VGRDGIFWIENVALNTGTSSLALTLSNPAGSTTTNFTLIQSSVGLSVNTVQAGDTMVSGTIGASGYTVWVNGVQASQASGTWNAQIAPVGVNGGQVTVTACPSSGPNLNTQATVEAPQGVFVSAYHHNQQTDDFIRENGGVVPQHYSDTLDWQDGQGGTNLLSGYVDYLFQQPELDETDWPATAWPQALTNGAETTIIWCDFPPAPPTVTTNTSIADPPMLPQVHCDVNQTPCGGPNVRRTEDAEIMLATGGPLGSTQQNMWMISAGATDAATGLPIPYDELYVGGFGNPDTNGNLVIMLPDNDPAGITVRAPGHDNYSFGATARKYNLLITCESPCPTNTHRLTIGVGELVDISLVPPLPYPYYLSNTWHSTAGSLSMWYGNTTVLTAPSNAATASVRMSYYNKGVITAQYITNFTVIEPSGVDHVVINSTTEQPINSGASGAYMHLWVYLAPTVVSFYRLNCMEVGQDASAQQGYYKQFTPQYLAHTTLRGANTPITVNYDNSWNHGWDKAAWVGDPPPWSPGGSFQWVIPGKWWIPGGPTNDIHFSDQTFTLGADGTMTVHKFGTNVTRTINNVITPRL
jgi:hypothetical protein